MNLWQQNLKTLQNTVFRAQKPILRQTAEYVEFFY